MRAEARIVVMKRTGTYFICLPVLRKISKKAKTAWAEAEQAGAYTVLTLQTGRKLGRGGFRVFEV